MYFTVICTVMLTMLSSCEKEFNPRDEYKDITIVYGLVNPVDEIHYIRIHKAFLSPESVIIMAQNPDLTTYPEEDLEVRAYEIIRNENGDSTGQTQLKTGTKIIHNKDDGFFYNGAYTAWYFEKKFDIPYRLDNTIKIEVENKKSGKISYAEIPVVNNFALTVPTSEIFKMEPKNYSRFSWQAAKYGRIYDFYFTFYYTEGRKIDSSDTDRMDSLTWHIGSRTAPQIGNDTLQIVNYTYYQGTFYEKLRDELVYDTSLRRRPYYRAKITVWCGGEELYYYNVINNPSQNIIPDPFIYTNLKTKSGTEELENETFGVFSSRIVQNYSVRLHEMMLMKYLTDTSVDRQFIPVPIYEW